MRLWAALLASSVAAIYALIAAHVLTVIDRPDAEVAKDQMTFATPAVAAYLAGAVLLWPSDRRLLAMLGALLQSARR